MLISWPLLPLRLVRDRPAFLLANLAVSLQPWSPLKEPGAVRNRPGHFLPKAWCGVALGCHYLVSGLNAVRIL